MPIERGVLGHWPTGKATQAGKIEPSNRLQVGQRLAIFSLFDRSSGR